MGWALARTRSPLDVGAMPHTPALLAREAPASLRLPGCRCFREPERTHPGPVVGHEEA